jgi:hypothetical protein
VAFRSGSAYWERPIQFWLVAPRLEGRRVMALLVPTGVPLTYRVPVLPDRVTARCDQVLVGSWPLRLMRCSPPLPPVVIANLGPPPALTVRNMYAPVPVPKSNTRDQVVVAAGLTHAETVKSPSPLTIAGGRST